MSRIAKTRTNKWEKSLRQVLYLLKEQDRHISVRQITSDIQISPDMYYNSNTQNWIFVKKILAMSNEIIEERMVQKKREKYKKKRQEERAINKVFDDFFKKIREKNEKQNI